VSRHTLGKGAILTSKIQKLYAAFLANQKNQSFRDFDALLNAFGFVLRRQSGSHRVYKHPGVREVMNIQPAGADAKACQVREFLDIIEQYGLQIDA
jgi:predicted RNA binding protein YcfA (HicA-like mRNA interferase family)